MIAKMKKHSIIIWVLAIIINAVMADVNAQIKVIHANSEWLIQGKLHSVSLNEKNLSMIVKDGDISWPMLPSDSTDMTCSHKNEALQLRLAEANNKKITPYKTGFSEGIKITLSQFMRGADTLDLDLQLFVTLEGDKEDLVFNIVPREGDASIKKLIWPKGFVPEISDYTVWPNIQGILLPRNWPNKVAMYRYEDVSNGRGLSMPWWGYLQGKSAAMIILETPIDAYCELIHPAGGPTIINPEWIHSLGKLNYTRKLRFSFFREGDYVTLAKRYREYAIENGNFVSLKEKIARTPLVGELIGSPIIHTSILYHTQPASDLYNKTDLAQNHQLATFYDRAQQLKVLAEKRNLKRAYLHLDGWGYRGYDNLHPDVLPPCEEAGGWNGMKYFGHVCDSLGFLFAIHDQYRDYYHDAASYDPRHAIIDENGEMPTHTKWLGGEQSILCASFAPAYLKRNHNELLSHGIKLKGAYLDVFSVVTPDECYNPEHPMSRRDCLKYRAECFNYVRTTDGVISSEEAEDWSVPYVDLVHHSPFVLDSNMNGGSAIGIPIPLFNLVYHDALIIPWALGNETTSPTGNNYVYLYGLTCAGMPYLSVNANDAEMEKVKTMCELNKRVGLLEMTNHEFLDGSFRKQRTTFADGTTVTIDLDANTFEINPKLPK
jgi:hypothetical protein